MMLYEPGRVFQLHENTCYSIVGGGGIGVVQTSPPVDHQFPYTVTGCSPKQVNRGEGKLCYWSGRFFIVGTYILQFHECVD